MAVSARREHHDTIHHGSSWVDLSPAARMPTTVYGRVTDTLHVTYDSTGRVAAAKYNGRRIHGRHLRETISDLLSGSLVEPTATMLAEPEKVISGVLKNIYSQGRYPGRQFLVVQTDDNKTLKLLSPDTAIPGQEPFVSYLLTLNGHWLEMSTVIDASVSKAFPIVVRADSYGKVSG